MKTYFKIVMALNLLAFCLIALIAGGAAIIIFVPFVMLALLLELLLVAAVILYGYKGIEYIFREKNVKAG